MKLTINKNSANGCSFQETLVGHGVLEEVGDVCRDLKLKGNALIVTGSTTRMLQAKSQQTSGGRREQYGNSPCAGQPWKKLIN